MRGELAAEDLNPSASREWLEDVIAEAKKNLSSSELKDCRHTGDAGRLARLKIVVGAGGWFFRSHLTRAGVPEVAIRRLWSTKSMTMRWAYMQVHHAMQWLGDGGLESAPDKDYVLLGSFFSGVVTLEHSVRRAYEDLSLMLRLPLELPR